MRRHEVAIARHTIFYKIFFTKHTEFLEQMISLSFTSLTSGFPKLSVFYGSYSYYLKDDDNDTYLKDMLNEKITDFSANSEYTLLKNMVIRDGLGGLQYEELIKHNKIYMGTLQEMLEVFEIYCNRFAPNDILPKLTENAREYDRSIVYVIYDSFYESLFAIHGKVHDALLDFNILKFEEAFKLLMIFFYGYSYYIQNDTCKVIKDGFKDLYKYYNNEEFLMAYYNLLQGKVSTNSLGTIKEYQTELFNKCINIFELINSDLPKSNLFPKRAEKVLIDTTGI